MGLGTELIHKPLLVLLHKGVVAEGEVVGGGVLRLLGMDRRQVDRIGLHEIGLDRIKRHWFPSYRFPNP